MGVYIRAGTRPSLLALKQVEIIQGYLEGLKFDIVPIETKGDKDKVRPLFLEDGTDFFTYEIEQALLDRKIDIAVHSAKDLEKNMPNELVVPCITRSPERRDCLVSSRGFTLDELPQGSVIGASSKNRKDSIARYRKDLVVKNIRGNIDERFDQLHRGDFDALIVAYIALIRLGYEKKASQVVPFDIIEPHLLQGSIAIQVRKDRYDLLEAFRGIDGK
ncbi:MAG: hydroxymethylbilane synthase [Candidatus Omnitrophota bacterium]